MKSEGRWLNTQGWASSWEREATKGNIVESDLANDHHLPHSHLARRKRLLKDSPAIRSLCGIHPPTALWIAALVTVQLLIGITIFPQLDWAVRLCMIWLVGAPISHALFVLMHECSHDLVLPKRWQNKVLGIITNLGQAIPSAISFRYYHLHHHSSLGIIGADPDLAPRWEASLVGNSSFRKASWLCIFGLSQALRPFSVHSIKEPPEALWNLNIALILTADVFLINSFGLSTLFYLLSSTVVSVGPHPLSGRWVAEHYTFFPGQQTSSMYGWANLFAFNMGYHAEHHDLPSVPWVNLPRLKALAPALYRQPSHHSWTGCFVRFIRDPSLSLSSRIINKKAG